MIAVVCKSRSNSVIVFWSSGDYSSLFFRHDRLVMRNADTGKLATRGLVNDGLPIVDIKIISMDDVHLSEVISSSGVSSGVSSNLNGCYQMSTGTFIEIAEAVKGVWGVQKSCQTTLDAIYVPKIYVHKIYVHRIDVHKYVFIEHMFINHRNISW